jgi:hypothetical protein
MAQRRISKASILARKRRNIRYRVSDMICQAEAMPCKLEKKKPNILRAVSLNSPLNSPLPTSTMPLRWWMSIIRSL